LFTERDEISHSRAEETKDGLHIEVSTAYQVTIDNGGEEEKVWTTGGTVKKLLEAANITYDEKGKDKISPAIDEQIEKGNTISIVRVSEDEETITEVIPFETTGRSFTRKGPVRRERGLVKKVYQVTNENGKEISRELISEDVTESVDRIVAVGTKEEAAIATLSSSNSTANGKTFTMTASAFTSGCSGCSGMTATGINLKANPNMKVIAVDPNKIPLGTRVWVEGYGEAIAGDAGVAY